MCVSERVCLSAVTWYSEDGGMCSRKCKFTTELSVVLVGCGWCVGSISNQRVRYIDMYVSVCQNEIQFDALEVRYGDSDVNSQRKSQRFHPI